MWIWDGHVVDVPTSYVAVCVTVSLCAVQCWLKQSAHDQIFIDESMASVLSVC